MMKNQKIGEMNKALLDEQAMIEELCAHYGEQEVELLIAQARTDTLIELYNDMSNSKMID